MYWGVVLGVIVALLNAVWRVVRALARAVQANELLAFPLVLQRTVIRGGRWRHRQPVSSSADR